LTAYSATKGTQNEEYAHGDQAQEFQDLSGGLRVDIENSIAKTLLNCDTADA
jgi:hypothetical protein